MSSDRDDDGRRLPKPDERQSKVSIDCSQNEQARAAVDMNVLESSKVASVLCWGRVPQRISNSPTIKIRYHSDQRLISLCYMSYIDGGSMPSHDRTGDLLTYVGYSTSHCGYCGQDDTSHSFGVWAHVLSAETYQDLIDRGWRRSGCYLYRPNLRRSCCKSYTIRLDALAFKADKKHRQALNKFNRFVLGEQHENTVAQKGAFDLETTLHAAEAQNLKSEHMAEHEFRITFTSSVFTKEKMALYKKYQVTVHHDPPSKVTATGFTRFLCDSPILSQKLQDKPCITLEDGAEMTWGSCHQLYRLDGKLIAMAVLDILPNCVSSVYFMYDPDYSHLSLGRVSACRELSLAKSLSFPNNSQSSERGTDGGWYYMGFYIPSCTKMVYKGEYSPSYLLDPFSDLAAPSWHPLEIYRKHWNAAKKETSNAIDWLYSVSQPQIRSITDLLDVDEQDLSSPETLDATDMPGRDNTSTNSLTRVVILSNDGKFRLLDRALQTKHPDMLGQVCAMVSVLGRDILEHAIFTLPN